MSAVCKLQASSPASESLGSALILPWLNTISLLITSIRCLLWNTREGQERLNLPRQGWQSSRQLKQPQNPHRDPLVTRVHSTTSQPIQTRCLPSANTLLRWRGEKAWSQTLSLEHLLSWGNRSQARLVKATGLFHRISWRGRETLKLPLNPGRAESPACRYDGKSKICHLHILSAFPIMNVRFFCAGKRQHRL